MGGFNLKPEGTRRQYLFKLRKVFEGEDLAMCNALESEFQHSRMMEISILVLDAWPHCNQGDRNLGNVFKAAQEISDLYTLVTIFYTVAGTPGPP